MLTSFATIATEIAYADASVARVALLTVFKVICCCNATAMMPIATTNALSILRVPGQTATLQLLLLTSFATIATAMAYGDARCCSRCSIHSCHCAYVVTAFPESTNCYAGAATATAMLLLLLRRLVLLQLLLRSRFRYCAYQETLLCCHDYR